ncbi:choline-sulfatase [Dongia rigui]|uniref:Choline-sulfatase n=1 Tax=Dongia rigui TaxID=940149 RepID=A0ABU5DUD6_9PROT|nr:choline-sulfatase [Dongia rigui]MDY0870592.1 choline-sulfatase [Dongia rigui]
MSRPNILFVMFDQLAALSLPAYGHKLVKTPHIDALAARGTLFENAYCAAPLCSPSRFGMLSGLLPSRFGAFDNASELPSSMPTFLHVLRRAGYRTCLSGKMDFTGADQLHGYEERLTTDLSPSDLGWTPDWDHGGDAQPWYHTLQSVAEAGPCDYSLSLQYDEDATFKARQWLHQHAGAKDGRPFMLTLSVMHPHDPYLALRPFWDMYAHDAIDMPVVPRQDDAAGRRMYQLYDRGEIPLTSEQIRRARHAYYGMISYCDALLGRLVDTLKSLGQLDNTIVIVTSDHGDMLGERGMWYKMTFFDRAIRVPLVFAGPGIKEGQRVAPPVSHLDLMSTFADMVGGGLDGLLQDGQSLLPVLAGKAQPQGRIAAEYMGEGYEQPAIMLRVGSLKFTYAPDDGPTLYDLAADPRELKNLAADPAHAADVASFTEAANARWNFAHLRDAVLASQRRRRLVHDALVKGRLAPWDFEPRQDAASTYYRNWGVDLPDPDAALRLPRRG